MDIPKMNILFIIVVILQICVIVNSQPVRDRSWGPSPAPAPSLSRGPTQGSSVNPSWGSPQRSTGSSSWVSPQSSTGGSSRPSQGTCNCGLYETCAMVRHGNAPSRMGCINAFERRMLIKALNNSNAGGHGRRPDNHIPINSNPQRVSSRVPPWRVGAVSDTESVSNTGIQGRVSNISGDAYGIYYLFYPPGVSTGQRVNITKTGYCRRVPATRSSRACVPSCLSDTDCSGDRKCCPNGCSIGCAPIQAQPSGSGRGSEDLPGRPSRRLSHGRLRVGTVSTTTRPHQHGFRLDLPNMRLLKVNDVARTRLSEASGLNGQRPRTFRGHSGSGTERFVQQPNVRFVSRRQSNVRNTPRFGYTRGAQSGSDLATQGDILNTGTQSSSRSRQPSSAVGIRGRHVTDSRNTINRHSIPPARQRHTTTRQVQRRQNAMQTILGQGFQTVSDACGEPCREHADCYSRFDISYFCFVKAPCLKRSCQRILPIV